MLVDSAKRKECWGGGGFTEGLFSKERVYTCIRKNKNTQVIPQTGLSLGFELQRMCTTIKSNIAGDANKKTDYKRTFVSLS